MTWRWPVFGTPGPMGDQGEAVGEVGDDREALTVWFDEHLTAHTFRHLESEDFADGLLAAGFRRTVSPAPSGAEAALASDADYWRGRAEASWEREDVLANQLIQAHGPLERVRALADEFARRQSRNAAHNGGVSCSVWGLAGAELRSALAPSAGPDEADDES